MISNSERISSRNNPKIKNIVQLQKHSERQNQGVFIVEGLKEIEKAIWAGYQFSAVFFLPKLIEFESVKRFFGKALPSSIYEITADVYEKIAYRENTGGIVTLAKSKTHGLNNHKVGLNPFYLVIEGVEKPGTLGAIYRTADAAGVDAIIICGSGTDIYNPNAIRASLGCVFTVPTILTNTGEAIGFLKQNKVQVFCTYLNASMPYHSVDFTRPSAIVMGTEATGISELWIEAADANIIIPMRGAADSMNVSTSAAVLIFEVRRQRGF